jgi:hypothetical protein
MVALIVVMLVTPLWPAYGEAIARGDTLWVRRTLVRSTWCLTLFTLGCSVVLVFLGQPILRLWAGPLVSPPLSLMAGFAVWTVLWTAGSTVAAFLNGAGVLRFQVITAIAPWGQRSHLKILLAQTSGSPGNHMGDGDCLHRMRCDSDGAFRSTPLHGFRPARGQIAVDVARQSHASISPYVRISAVGSYADHPPVRRSP